MRAMRRDEDGAIGGHPFLIPPRMRSWPPPQPLQHLFHDRTAQVTQCGRICIQRRKINFSTVFAGQTVGIREVADKIWLVRFMQYDLGFFDEEVGRVESAENPFIPKKC